MPLCSSLGLRTVPRVVSSVQCCKVYSAVQCTVYCLKTIEPVCDSVVTEAETVQPADSWRWRRQVGCWGDGDGDGVKRSHIRVTERDNNVQTQKLDFSGEIRGPITGALRGNPRSGKKTNPRSHLWDPVRQMAVRQ